MLLQLLWLQAVTMADNLSGSRRSRTWRALACDYRRVASEHAQLCTCGHSHGVGRGQSALMWAQKEAGGLSCGWGGRERAPTCTCTCVTCPCLQESSTAVIALQPSEILFKYFRGRVSLEHQMTNLPYRAASYSSALRRLMKVVGNRNSY